MSELNTTAASSLQPDVVKERESLHKKYLEVYTSVSTMSAEASEIAKKIDTWQKSLPSEWQAVNKRHECMSVHDIKDHDFAHFYKGIEKQVGDMLKVAKEKNAESRGLNAQNRTTFQNAGG
ncbi:hypothetical protein ERJ75_001712900 [Trypanosoma vivax]|nr:hypothetical protein ERJ75_001712900 [Trypanosoma vivax]